jgi:hypothetical protein
LLAALLAGFVNAPAHDPAQVSTTAAIAAQSPCQFTTFEEQTSFTRRFYSKAEYDRAKTNSSTECLRIQYLSDGLKVIAFLVKPRDPDGRRYPVIIYNRGGVQDIGKSMRRIFSISTSSLPTGSWCWRRNIVATTVRKVWRRSAAPMSTMS